MVCGVIYRCIHSRPGIGVNTVGHCTACIALPFTEICIILNFPLLHYTALVQSLRFSVFDVDDNSGQLSGQVISAVSCQLSPVTCLLSAVWYLLFAVKSHLSPVSYHLSPVICQLLPVICHLSLVTYQQYRYQYQQYQKESLKRKSRKQVSWKSFHP